MGDSRDRHSGAKRFIRSCCNPANLRIEDVDWATASKPTRKYNCFGFAMGKLKWWQPNYYDDAGILQNPSDHWPEGVEHKETIEAYIDAAKTEGFEVSQDGAWEDGWETIVLYFHENSREFTHAAKLKSPGVWASKIGPDSDIEHPPNGLDNPWYGAGRFYMKREWPYPGPLFVTRSVRSIF